ncbi:MAG: septation protein SepH [Corynebacterium sp.]|nr:septation protein SepH [Corynebacterium sp.]
MQEIHLIASESTATSFVFRSTADPEEQFFLAVDDSVRMALETALGNDPAATAPSTSDTSGGDTTDSTPELTPTSITDTADDEAVEDPTISAGSDTTTSTAEALASADQATGQAPDQAKEAEPERPRREVDPRLSSPLQDSPRQIQERIRSGASVAEVAAANGVTESRIEPFAHPILLERARIAEMAKQAHPVREDGPARLTLWEVLATAFAARGQDLEGATWDAFKENTRQWVISVSWQTGHSSNVAEWSYHASATSTPTAVARNGIAAELIDPQAPMNQRSLAAVNDAMEFGSTRFNQDEGLRALGGNPEPEIDELSDTRDDLTAVPDTVADSRDQYDAELEGEEFLQHPQKSTKKKRKAVTPHWEDVLLGVRANTQRPRNGK